MLYNDIERSIMERAVIRGMRPNAPEVITRHQAVVDDFLTESSLRGRAVLDIGPGQCDFLDIAKRRGATTFGVDFCPAVVELGVLRGHAMVEADVSKEWRYAPRMFDGIYCFGGLNVFWYSEDLSGLQNFLNQLRASLKPGGWLFAVPWNEAPPGYLMEPTMKITHQWLRSAGIELIHPDEAQRKKYLLTSDFNWRFPVVDIWHRAALPDVTAEA